MNEKHRDVIGKAYQSFNQRDIDTILDLMHISVIWPKGWEGDYIEGQAAVRDYWTKQWQEIDPNVKPLSLKENSRGQIEVMVHQIAKDLQGNIIADGIIKHIYTFEDGLIKKMEISKP